MNGHEPIHPTTEHGNNGEVSQAFGLTKREYFAAMAMQGILSTFEMAGSPNLEWVAKFSVDQSEALIKELDK